MSHAVADDPGEDETHAFQASSRDLLPKRDGSSAVGMPYRQIKVAGQPEGGIMPMPEQIPAGAPAHWLVYFGVQDARAATEKAGELGGRAEMEPMDVGVTTFSVLSDPLGAVFAVMEPLG